MFDFNGQNPQFPRRLLRILSMGCGISKFGQKEATEACPPNATHCYRNFHCLGGESKPLIGEGGNVYSPEDQSRKDDCSITQKENAGGLIKEEAAEKMKINTNMKRGDLEDGEDGTGRRNVVKEKDPDSVRVDWKLKENEEGEDRESEDCRKHEEEGNDQNYNGVFRGGSPSFREYCVVFDSGSKSIKGEDNDDGAIDCKWQNEETPNSEKGPETPVAKKERRGRSFMNALHCGKPGGVRNLLNASRRHHPNFSSSQHNDHSHKLLARAS